MRRRSPARTRPGCRYIGYSHEHPDHFSISFLKKFREDYRGKACFLRHNGQQVRECRTGVPETLAAGLRITVVPCSDGDSFGLIEAAGKTVLNLGDRDSNTRE
jgi:hypothetical protein